MSNLALVKSERFGNVQCDFYANDEVICMTSIQLGTAIEYSDPQKGIDNLISRNEYLKGEEFSVTLKLRGTDGKYYETRVFTEDGIYEVTMLAKTEKAKIFRSFVRKTLKALRTGKMQAIQPVSQFKMMEQETKAKNADARLMNARVRQSSYILKEMSKHKHLLSEQAVELLTINAFEIVTGLQSLPRPKVETTYSAEDIGKEAGVSSNMVGRVATKAGIKTDEYGITVLDKSKHSSKQVPAFRYNEQGKAKLMELLKPEGSV